MRPVYYALKYTILVKKGSNMDEFLKRELDLQYFHDHGYIRKQCSSCGAFFWALDKSADLCGDQPCVPFSFIQNPLTKKPLNLAEVRESFLSYFQHHDHARLCYPVTGERYPVIARWRTDIYLTIASIADFQPHVTSGDVPPPANPLVISQPCIRLNDLDEVGVSGRHLTTFEMMGHHAFNKHTDEIYWKNLTVFYCDDYFVNIIGIPKDQITYKEQLWFGGGNAGPCLEVLAGGLEIATLVFMNMRQDDRGSTVINGERYVENPLNIVDTGYGLERIAWISQGTPTIYETVFAEMISWIQDRTSGQGHARELYSLADHTKTLVFMLGDGIVPSNVKAGYLARLLIRRALRFMNILGMTVSLTDAVDTHLMMLTPEFPSLRTQRDQIKEILDLETQRYIDTLDKGEQMVKRLIKEKKTINDDMLITLYDTHGMPPSIVQSIAKQQQVNIKIPENFESRIAELHTHEKQQQEVESIPQGLPQTKPLYYDDHYRKEFDATVLWSQPKEEGADVILDQTSFYPEGGGQPTDQGVLITDDQKKISVLNVRKENGSIIHHINGILKVGDIITGRIDWDRRYTLMKHHTGTHVINGALRKILGEHIWQAGSQLNVEHARFDYTHYRPLTAEEIQHIEETANDLIAQKINVQKKIIDRNTAEKTYGFRLYQGGVPPGDQIRVLYIPGVDVEACGGTHLNNIGEIKQMKIIRSERIQDGVNRVLFAGGSMVDAYEKQEREQFETIRESLTSCYSINDEGNCTEQLEKACEIFSVPVEQMPRTIKRFLKEAQITGPHEVDTLVDACEHLFSSWKQAKKQEKSVSSEELQAFQASAEPVPGTEYQVITGVTATDANALAGAIIAQNGYIVHLYDGAKITSAASDDVPIDLRTALVPTLSKILGGGGGGRPRMIQCGGPNKDAYKEALQKAKELTIQTLQ